MNNEISYFFMKRLKFKAKAIPPWPSHPAIFLRQSRSWSDQGLWKLRLATPRCFW